MVFSNTLVTVIQPDGPTLYGHVFEDEGCKITVNFNLDGLRSEPALPTEPESQLESTPKKHNETRTTLGSRCEEQSESQLKPSPEAQPGIWDALQPNSQPETQPDPLHEEVKHAAKEAVKIESIRDRLGASVTYFEGLLEIGDVLKDVSCSFQTQPPTDYG